jgi:hypothetical protein
MCLNLHAIPDVRRVGAVRPNAHRCFVFTDLAAVYELSLLRWFDFMVSS